MRNRIYPYNKGSASARALAAALGILRLNREGGAWGRPQDTIINWGSSTIRETRAKVLNMPFFVDLASDKLKSMQIFSEQGVRVPEWTTSREAAQAMIDRGGTVLARTLLKAHSGRGIVSCGGDQPLVEAPLYCRYVKKAEEYRVHVLRGEVIDMQRKVKAPDREVRDWQIRNHANGFIFQRNELAVPADVTEQAVKAVFALGLDFGAVDVGWNKHEGQAYVYEVNTAPGLTGSTLVNYAEKFYSLLRRSDG